MTKLTDAQLRIEVDRRRRDLESARTIAAQLGAHHERVRRLVTEHDTAITRLSEYAAAGVDLPEIARRHGVGGSALQAIVDRCPSDVRAFFRRKLAEAKRRRKREEKAAARARKLSAIQLVPFRLPEESTNVYLAALIRVPRYDARVA